MQAQKKNKKKTDFDLAVGSSKNVASNKFRNRLLERFLKKPYRKANSGREFLVLAKALARRAGWQKPCN